MLDWLGEGRGGGVGKSTRNTFTTGLPYLQDFIPDMGILYSCKGFQQKYFLDCEIVCLSSQDTEPPTMLFNESVYWSLWKDIGLLVCIWPGSPGQKHMGICRKQKSSTCSRCGREQCLNEEQVCPIPKQLSLCFVTYLETPIWDREPLQDIDKILFTKMMLCGNIQENGTP